MRKLWDDWKSDPPPDPSARSILKVDHHFPDNSAGEVLRIYKDNLTFIGGPSSDTLPPEPAGVNGQSATQEEGVIPPAKVKVGDYVQWTSDDQEQFDTPRRVTWISDDGMHARVFGSMTGIPTAELALREPPPGAPPPSVHTERKPLAQLADRPDINVLLTASGRLEITADVDGEGLKTLRAMLDKYEEILKLLAPSNQTPS